MHSIDFRLFSFFPTFSRTIFPVTTQFSLFEKEKTPENSKFATTQLIEFDIKWN